MTVKRALLVGVGEYHDSWWENREANKRDVARLKELLLSKFAFTEDNITTLTGLSATKANILVHLRHLVELTGPDDVTVFAFSGHGDRLETSGKLSGYSETLVPYDGVSRRRDTHITDTELRTVLEAFRSINVTVILDSCHSAGATRGQHNVSYSTT